MTNNLYKWNKINKTLKTNTYYILQTDQIDKIDSNELKNHTTGRDNYT